MTGNRMICVTGGIGCGKSVVCRILRIRGFHVIDSDALARSIMDTDDNIKSRLKKEIADTAVREDNSIDRKRLADIVFNDQTKLKVLNSIVHEQVREKLRIIRESAKLSFFVETALFFQSGLNNIAEAEWRVVAPVEIRIERVMRRNDLSRADVSARINSQRADGSENEKQPELSIIRNDGSTPLLPQIDAALTKYELPWTDKKPFC